MAENLLEIKSLKTYFFLRRGVIKAVDGVDLSLNEAETLGLVGESGCGKTMTCLSIVRLVPEPEGRIVAGQILFEGEDLLKKTSKEMRNVRGRKISFIFQDPMSSLNPAFTVGEQVAEAIRIHQHVRGRAMWAQVKDILQKVQISSPEARMRDYPFQMSGGMRQRVVGGIALSCHPRLIIADEPTTSLDVTIQAQYLKFLKQVQQEERVSMIFITHNFGLVARMCDKVSVMYAGKIMETASTREIFNHPVHPYTQALMNCLPRIETKGEILATIGGQPPDMGNLPSGCKFAPRCPVKSNLNERCQEEEPPLVAVERHHNVRCWLAGE
jgi:oligopeptide/dipeptide ABC transporter ATP-binding protein